MYQTGIFNETFDTVLYKPELRSAQLYRFASELLYCIINDDIIILAEQHGTDQAFIMRLMSDALQPGSNLRQVVSQFRIVQKPNFGADRKVRPFIPLADSLAASLFNPDFDFSCLGNDIETSRRRLVRERGIPEPGCLLTEGISLIESLGGETLKSGEDEISLAWWARLLHGGRALENLGANEGTQLWNERAENQGLPQLAVPNTSALDMKMGPAVVRIIKAQHDRSLDTKVAGFIAEGTPGTFAPEAIQENYFGSRSRFYTQREKWEKTLDHADFQFLKEVIDSTYNVLVAHSCGARQKVFLPGDLTSQDQQQAHHAVAAACGKVSGRSAFGLLYQSQPQELTWDHLRVLLQGANEALTAEPFRKARAAYVSETDRVERREAFKRLADEVNRFFPAAVRLEINSNNTLTLRVKPAGEEGWLLTSTPEPTATTQGEHRHDAA